MGAVGKSVPRKEAYDKVSGRARYNSDLQVPGCLIGSLVASPHAHARILSVDTAPAMAVPGVRAVVTGQDTDLLCGEVLEDRPPLARGKVRYYGEPVALVVADDERAAMRGAAAVRAEYEPLPAVNSPEEALRPGAPLVHEHLGDYKQAQEPVYPEPGSNVADRAKVRKGDMAAGWAAAQVVVECDCHLPQMDHAAMETRSARAEVLPDGRMLVHAGTQAPFEVQKMLAQYFQRTQGSVEVIAPLLGGAFGGKAAVQLEVLAALGSLAVDGRAVHVANTRERDIAGSPVGCGLEAHVKLGADRSGRLIAAELTYCLDIGAYADSAPRVARAVASACTGPYAVDNVWAEVLCCYTNHVYTTALRGFGYMPVTFAVERAMDRLAFALGMDALELRRRNAIGPGATTPTQVRLTKSLIGNLGKCLDRVGQLIDWSEGQRVELADGRVRARGVASLWKTSSSPQDAISGAILTFNKEGSVNLAVGAVEVGAGTRTTAAQIAAERLGIGIEQVHVRMEVDTQVDPEHWKTVASMGTFMVGRAVQEAADDAVSQIKATAAVALRCPPGDLDVSGGRVYLRDDPEMYLDLGDVVHGYKYPDGDSIGAQVIGRGGFIMRHLTLLDRETGKGMPGPSWTVGAQAVEVEFDPRDATYRIVRAASVIDAGRVINPQAARGMVMGGMCQGLGYASRECVLYGAGGEVVDDQLRTYKLMRAGEEPHRYLVEFLETPQDNAPYGARPVGEHGIIGMPAALASALSAAAECELTALPLTPEVLWRARGGAEALAEALAAREGAPV